MTPSPDDLAGKVREAWAATLPSRTDSPYRNQLESALAALLARAEEAERANNSAAVCAAHLPEFIGDGCLVCEREAAEDALRVARRTAYEVGCPNWPHPGIVGCAYCAEIEEKLAAITQAEDRI